MHPQGAGRTNPRVCEERVVWPNEPKALASPLTRFKFWPNEPDALQWTLP